MNRLRQSIRNSLADLLSPLTPNTTVTSTRSPQLVRDFIWMSLYDSDIGYFQKTSPFLSLDDNLLRHFWDSKSEMEFWKRVEEWREKEERASETSCGLWVTPSTICQVFYY